MLGREGDVSGKKVLKRLFTGGKNAKEMPRGFLKSGRGSLLTINLSRKKKRDL